VKLEAYVGKQALQQQPFLMAALSMSMHVLQQLSSHMQFLGALL
jgi:hypothetical protein